MPEPSYKDVETLFHQAAELDPAQRGAFLEERCAGDPTLRAAVEELLHFDAVAQGEPDFLRGPTCDIRPTLTAPDTVPVSFGRYRVLRRLGEGGMGTVYEAEQDDPRRTVALKVMRQGFDSPDHRKRFSQEALILGRLHHVGIAQVYEAGTTEDGRLYFAMEFIDGLQLHELVRRHTPDTNARLELAARVCDAVQYAHEQGVIHRDLKPANILVDPGGQPKVLDFGVAHATDTGIVVSTAHTRTGQLLGTLGYMSPEQVAGDPRAIDARSDVYALGVILYELLAGRLPYQLDHLPIPEMVRVIQEVEPSRLGSVNRQFRGDIETIVAKTLEKDRARRYPSAGELGEDLRRYLAGEPIRARPASALYKVRKFVSRNRGLVAGAALVFAALLAATVISLLSARNAWENARLARTQAYQARLAAAVAALTGHDVADAARQLEHAPEELRGWEWYHVHSRLDDRSGQILAAPGASFILIRRPGGIEVGQLVPHAGSRVTDLDGRPLRTLPWYSEEALEGGVLETGSGLRVLQWIDQVPRLLGEAATPHLRLVIARSACLSPDGSRLATIRVLEDKREDIDLYEVASGKRTALLAAHKAKIWAITFSQDSTRLASADDAGLVCVWDATTGARIASCPHPRKVLSLAFRPDGARLVTTSADGIVRQWDPATSRQVEPAFDHHSGEVLAAAYSPDGEWVASGGTDRTIRLWRATGQREIAVLHGHTGAVSELAFTPDGRRLASVSQERGPWRADHSVGTWEVDFGSSLPVLRGHTKYVYPVACSPDGRWIASGDWDNVLRLWDARTGEVCAEIDNGDIVKTLAYSPDGSWLVSARQEWLQVWDAATGRRLKEIKAPAPNILAVAFHPDGATLAALDGSGGGTIFNATTGVEVARLRLGASHDTRALAYSPDGRWLAGTSTDGKTVCLFDARTYELSAQLSGHEGVVCSVAFSADSGRLASCGADQIVRVWQIGSRACQTLIGHTDEVFAVTFHPDGHRLASAGRDGAIWLWDLASGQEVARLPGHSSYVWSLAFSPDGKTLVSGSGDTTVRLWDTEPLRVRYQARRAAEALRPEAQRLVKGLFQQKDAAEVVAAVRADRSLSEPQRDAALRAVLRTAVPQRKQ
jgi:WD40 repeat protein/predicted Ser/Thr protein kinase